MAFILQVSSGILSEAQLSLLGLGPKTTEVPTLGLMMNWAMLYSARIPTVPGGLTSCDSDHHPHLFLF